LNNENLISNSPKRLIINLISSIVSFLVSIGISFFFTPYIVTSIGKEAYGFIGLANNFVSYAQLFTLALNFLAFRFITINLHKKNYEEASKYFSTVLLGNIYITGFLFIPTAFLIFNLSFFIDIPLSIQKDVTLLFILVFLNFSINLISNVFNVATFATNRLDISAQRNIESNLLRVGSLIILFFLLKPSIYFIGISALISTFYLFIMNIYYTFKLIPSIKINFAYFEINKLFQLIFSGLWSVITKLGHILSDGLDLLIANIFINSSAMGILAIAKTVPSAFASLISLISNVFLPNQTMLYAKNDIYSLVEDIKKSMIITGFFTNIPLIILISLGNSFYTLWVPSENSLIIQILAILTIQNLLVSGVINNLFGVFSITNHLKLNSLISVMIGILSSLIVFALLSSTSIGIYAVAGVSTTIAIIKNLTFTPIYASKCLKISYFTFYPIIFRYLFSSLLFSIICLTLQFFLPSQTWPHLIISGFIMGIFGLILNYFFLLKKQERNFLNLFISNYLLKFFKEKK
jgi:O-antigen/teichoic acid export membrane protein